MGASSIEPLSPHTPSSAQPRPTRMPTAPFSRSGSPHLRRGPGVSPGINHSVAWSASWHILCLTNHRKPAWVSRGRVGFIEQSPSTGNRTGGDRGGRTRSGGVSSRANHSRQYHRVVPRHPLAAVPVWHGVRIRDALLASRARKDHGADAGPESLAPPLSFQGPREVAPATCCQPTLVSS